MKTTVVVYRYKFKFPARRYSQFFSLSKNVRVRNLAHELFGTEVHRDEPHAKQPCGVVVLSSVTSAALQLSLSLEHHGSRKCIMESPVCVWDRIHHNGTTTVLPYDWRCDAAMLLDAAMPSDFRKHRQRRKA